MKARVAIAVALGLVTLAGPGVAFAAWSGPGSGFATGRAFTMPVIDAPVGTATGRNVVLTWAQASFPDSTEVDGYVLERFDASDTPQGVGAPCSGTITALMCTEEAVPPGTWTYRVTPRHHGWIGLPSASSASVTVGSPSLTLTPPTTFGTLPGTLIGSLENFVTGEIVTFRLDDPVSGTALDANVADSPIPFSGASTVDVTIPAPTTAGLHTVYATGSMGSQASAPFSVSPHDVSAPVVGPAAVAKSTGGTAGFVRPGGQYRVYASVTDVGSPATGVATVRANVSALTTGATSVALTAGSFTVDGVTYNYRSGVQTVSASTTPGAKSFSITATDVGANTGTQGGISVTVDGVAPSAADVQAMNAGPTPGRMETGDQLVLTYSEQMDPSQILAGWTGEATAVTVRLQNNGGGDRITIRPASGGGALPLGTVFLNRTDYTTANRNFTASTMVMSGTTITITVGTPNGAVTTAAAAATMTWTPSNTSTDLAGNACTTTTRSELGALDLDL